MTTGGGRRRVPSLLLVAIIAGTFASASLLAYQVYGVVCKQEEMTTRAYRAYAHFAAWTFSREATHKLEASMRAIFRPVGDLAGEAGPLPAPGIVLSGATMAGKCRC